MVKDLSRLATPQGIIQAIAMDQRGSLMKYMGNTFGRPPAPDEISRFKSLVTEALSPYASAMLLDPEYGLSATKRRAEGCGLLLAYEVSGTSKVKVVYDGKQAEEQLSQTLPNWNAQQLATNGADAVKLLVYYHPNSSPETNEHQQNLVRRVGNECRQNNVPFFLEIMTYDREGEGNLAFARAKPHLVTSSMKEFSNPGYGVDVLKVEPPFDLQFTKGTRSHKGNGYAYELAQLEEFVFMQNEAAGGLPFIVLTGGVPTDVFLESLEILGDKESQYSGMLAGRGIWLGAVNEYSEGEDAVRLWLATTAVANQQEANRRLGRAVPWYTRSK